MLTFTINPTHFKGNDKKVKGLDIYLAHSEDSEALADISQKAFKGYRGHYHNNPFLDEKKCSEVYFDWARQLPLIKEMADAVFIARMDGASAGFASLKVMDNQIAKAGLLGVDPSYRGRRVSTMLHHERFKWCIENGIKEFEVETSLTNTNYISILNQIGFKIKSSVYIFHLVLAK
jgi:GNAT superfamily N-acetyltransferase